MIVYLVTEKYESNGKSSGKLVKKNSAAASKYKQEDIAVQLDLLNLGCDVMSGKSVLIMPEANKCKFVENSALSKQGPGMYWAWKVVINIDDLSRTKDELRKIFMAVVYRKDIDNANLFVEV